VNASDERREQVLQAINEVIDPCSAGIASPTGLLDMGLVERVVIDGSRVSIVLTTTAPQCMFVGSFETEAQGRVAALPWVENVEVQTDYTVDWDESRMSELARRRLDRRHVEPRGDRVIQRVGQRRRRTTSRADQPKESIT
jgi:metal-sulfur cluster biosynthetic enzyme